MVPGEDVARVKRELPLRRKTAWPREPCSACESTPAPMWWSSVRILRFRQRRQTHPARCTRAGYGPRRDHFGTILYRQRGEPFELATQAGQALRQSLESAQPPPSQPSGEGRSSISYHRAYDLYGGQERLWAFDYIHAAISDEEPVGADPGYPLSQLLWPMHGSIWATRDEAAQKIGGHALSRALGRDRLLIDGSTMPRSRTALALNGALCAG